MWRSRTLALEAEARPARIGPEAPHGRAPCAKQIIAASWVFPYAPAEPPALVVLATLPVRAGTIDDPGHSSTCGASAGFGRAARLLHQSPVCRPLGRKLPGPGLTAPVLGARYNVCYTTRQLHRHGNLLRYCRERILARAGRRSWRPATDSGALPTRPRLPIEREIARLQNRSNHRRR